MGMEEEREREEGLEGRFSEDRVRWGKPLPLVSATNPVEHNAPIFIVLCFADGLAVIPFLAGN